jgi:hypothetical protein
MELTSSVIRRLSVARYLYHLATSNGQPATDVSSHACINILHDAIEMYFVAAAEHLDVVQTSQTKFFQYLDGIAAKLGSELPYRKRLLEINRVRIASKHDGQHPVWMTPT